jgi:uncharacterized protein YfaQ (DUF2300 family)
MKFLKKLLKKLLKFFAGAPIPEDAQRCVQIKLLA